MKKMLILLLSSALFFSACNTYKSITNASKVSELKGNPFMYHLSKSVIKNLSSFASKSGANSGKINLLTSLSSVFSTSEQIGGLKDVLVLNYRIPQKKIDSGFGKLLTVKDLINFVAKNGRGFNFYSTNSSL